LLDDTVTLTQAEPPHPREHVVGDGQLRVFLSEAAFHLVRGVGMRRGVLNIVIAGPEGT
jgi:hypothetical protein